MVKVDQLNTSWGGKAFRKTKELKSLWKETKEKFDQLEKSLVDCYIAFLREVAKVYLQLAAKSP